jgi:hypothetical protein
LYSQSQCHLPPRVAKWGCFPGTRHLRTHCLPAQVKDLKKGLMSKQELSLPPSLFLPTESGKASSLQPPQACSVSQPCLCLQHKGKRMASWTSQGPRRGKQRDQLCQGIEIEGLWLHRDW